MKHVTYSEMAVELSKDWGKNAKDPESVVLQWGRGRPAAETRRQAPTVSQAPE